MQGRILVVHSDERQRSQLAEAFERVGLASATAASGSEALSLVDDAGIDGMVLDLALSDGSGFDVVRAARRRTAGRDLAILALSELFATPSCQRDAAERFDLLGLLPSTTGCREVVDIYLRRRQSRPSLSPSPPPKQQQPRRHEVTQRASPRRATPSAPPSPPSSLAAPPAPPDLRRLTPLAGSYTNPRPQEIGRPPADAQPQLPAPRPSAPPELAAELLRGELIQVPFPLLLHELHQNRASGTLYLRQDRKKKVVLIADGVPRQVRSNLVQECLGRILQREGLITDEALEASIAQMKARSVLQGQVLLEMGSISERGLKQGLRRQIERKLLEAFAWTWGAYRFSPGSDASAQADDEGGLRVCELVREGMLRFYPADRVAQELDALRDERPVWARELALREQPMGLDPEEEAFFALLDGYRNVAQLVQDGGLPRDHAERLLLALLYVRKAELRTPTPMPGHRTS